MPKKILVVDDDPDIHDFCRSVLEAAGYAGGVRRERRGGPAAMAAERPDLVVLDVMMEAADAGFEMAQWLASEHPGLPVLMLSSIADAADQVFDTSTLPVSELVNKPITPKELLRQVRERCWPRARRA